MNQPTPYFGTRTWNDISREERFFCAELYFTLSRMPSLKPCIEWLNSRSASLGLTEDDQWTVGYEVCFYRDMIHAFGLDGSHGIRGKQNPETQQPFMPKRTFDLALFHPSHIVIIEAKAQQGLDREQLASFERDAVDIRAMLKAMHRTEPTVHMVLLAQEQYVRSPMGLANHPPFAAALSWKEVADQGNSWGADAKAIAAFRRADTVG